VERYPFIRLCDDDLLCKGCSLGLCFEGCLSSAVVRSLGAKARWPSGAIVYMNIKVGQYTERNQGTKCCVQLELEGCRENRISARIETR